MLTPPDYENLFTYALVNPDANQQSQIAKLASGVSENMDRYRKVEAVARVPALLVALLHARESSQDFSRHLHNGDPLTARTTHVPEGRPVPPPASGSFPYTWEESAADALSQVWKPATWSLGTGLEFLERYNGLGYQLKHGINSPYLWAFTNKYASGYYTADGTWSPTATCELPGCASILLWLKHQGVALAFNLA